MPLLKLSQVSLNYGTHILLDHVDLVLQPCDKVGLLGRNGSGKTTLLKLLGGLNAPDSGERWLDSGIRVGWLGQSLPDADQQSIYDYVASGLPEIGQLLSRYHALLHHGENTDLKLLEQVQHELEAKDGWLLQQRVETILSQLHLPADTPMAELSGGWRRRASLARALVAEPDLLLLDEPTNHLDIPAIGWLAQQLQNFSGALVLVTHDRAFLREVANQIIELDRGRLITWQGDYTGFLKHKEAQLAAEERASAEFDKKLAQEERWIRQGIKARRTRNEGRVRALKAMRAERAERRELQGSARFGVEGAAQSGKIVAELTNVSHAFGGQPVIRDFSSLVIRGDRIGIVGVNGAGKTTLLKILLGELTPDAGSVKLGSKLAVAYFDQLRQSLDMDKNLIENICGGREFIEINGKNRHAISYLSDFLFGPERTRTPLKALSGGEQNRAILASLFSKPANVLVLDEPTNDLDIETLELLEEILLEFEGTVFLVSHDREFMDKVVTGIYVFEGSGKVTEHVGGYSDWVARGGSLLDTTPSQEVKTSQQGPPKAAAAKSKGANARADSTRKKLSYKDQRELDGLPARIEQLETRVQDLETLVSAPDFYQGDQASINARLSELAEAQAGLEQAYQRWEALEAMQEQ